jgi:glycosyltransferase involved in cell wall biosynthesis
MKVLHILWSLDFGGIERLVLDLAVEQRQQGMDACVLAGKAGGRMASLFVEAGIPVVDAGLKNGFDPGRSKRREITSAMAKADILHMHSFNPALARFARLSGKPVVYTEHGNFGFGRRITWRDHIKDALQARFLRCHAAYLTFNSQFTRGVAKERFPIDACPNRVVYNGIDLRRFDGNDELKAPILPIPDDVFVVGTSSRLAGFKRIDRLLRAFAALASAGDCHLLVVGDGVMRGDLESFAAEAGIADKVTFAGFQSDVRAYQQRMDVCVFPSRHEPFGLVAVETLALGKPTVVMRDGGGLVEIIEPLEPENIASDVTALTARLEHFYELWRKGKLNDDTLAEARRVRARKFSIAAMSNAFQNVYAGCITGFDGYPETDHNEQTRC